MTLPKADRLVVLWVMRQWSPWSARTFVAALVVTPTSLGTSMSAAVVGGDVDELASVRATVGKAEAGVDQENATEEREGMAAKEGLDAFPGSRGGVGGGGPSRRVALPVVIPNQVGLASLVVRLSPPWLGCGVGP
jgi:hypothetical protein